MVLSPLIFRCFLPFSISDNAVLFLPSASRNLLLFCLLYCSIFPIREWLLMLF